VSQVDETLRNFCKNTSLGEVKEVRQQHLIFLESHQDLNKGFETLAKNDILSAPVYDHKAHKFVGLLDIRDFIAYVLFLYGQAAKAPKEWLVHQKALVPQNFTLVNLSEDNPFVGVDEEAQLFDTIEHMARHKVHRLAVVSHKVNDKVIRMVSQSAIVDFLVEKEAEIGGVLCNSVAELGVGSYATIHAVHEDSPLLDAFKLMHQKKVNGCAVVDQHGVLVGNISVSDLKYTIQMDISTTNFLSMEELRVEKRELVVCEPTTFVLDVMKKMAANRVHRVYVVNNEQEMKVRGVVTMTDILLKLASLIGAL